jgi:hypothetical protein
MIPVPTTHSTSIGSDHDIDTVIPIPETSRTAALQCAHGEWDDEYDDDGEVYDDIDDEWDDDIDDEWDDNGDDDDDDGDDEYNDDGEWDEEYDDEYDDDGEWDDNDDSEWDDDEMIVMMSMMVR